MLIQKHGFDFNTEIDQSDAAKNQCVVSQIKDYTDQKYCQISKLVHSCRFDTINLTHPKNKSRKSQWGLIQNDWENYKNFFVHQLTSLWFGNPGGQISIKGCGLMKYPVTNTLMLTKWTRDFGQCPSWTSCPYMGWLMKVSTLCDQVNRFSPIDFCQAYRVAQSSDCLDFFFKRKLSSGSIWKFFVFAVCYQ